MKLKELNQTTIAYFREFDPFSILSRTNFPGRIVLGALEEGDDGYDLPVGLAICLPSAEDLRIEWLYIAPDYQSGGLGSELFYQLCDFALEQGYKSLSVYLIKSGLQHTFTLGAEDFFQDQGLKTREATPGEWRSDLKHILSQPFFKAPSLVPVLSLAVLTEDEVDDLYLDFHYDRPEDILRYIDFYDFFYSIEENESQENAPIIKKEISFLCRGRQDSLMGALLMAENDGELSPMAFFAENEEIARSLFEASFLAASKIYGDDCHFTARLWQETYAALMNDMIPDGHVSAVLLRGSLTDMTSQASLDASYGILQESLPADINLTAPAEALPFADCKEMTTTLGKLAGNPYFAETTEVSHFEPLNLLTMEELSGLIESINQKRKGSAFTAIPQNSDFGWLESDLSAMIREDGKVQSAFLIGIDEEDRLFPLALHSEKNLGLLQISEYMQHVLKSARAKYDDDKIVDVRIYNANVKNMCRKII